MLAPLLAASDIAKHVHDAKTLEVLLLRRGLRLAGVVSDPMLAAYLLDASRTRYIVHRAPLAAIRAGENLIRGVHHCG